MSRDITRGPWVCPSCGEENSPTASQCWLCLTLRGRAVQTTTAPARGDVRLPPLHTEPIGLSKTGCATVAAWVGVAILTLVSAGVTFFLVCSAGAAIEAVLPPNTFGSGEEGLGPVILGTLCPGAVAAVLVATLIIVAFARRRR